MDICDEIIVAKIVVRGILLFSTALGGMLCIYLGWRLYRDTVISHFSGDLKTTGIKIKVTSASPGIILAGFGVWLLTLVAQHQFVSESVETTTPPDQATYNFPLYESSSIHFLPVSATEQPTKVIQKKSPTVNCVMYKRQFDSFSIGTESINPQDMLESISLAIEILRKIPIPDSSEEKAQRLKMLKTLSDLKSAAQDTVYYDKTEKIKN